MNRLAAVALSASLLASSALLGAPAAQAGCIAYNGFAINYSQCDGSDYYGGGYGGGGQNCTSFSIFGISSYQCSPPPAPPPLPPPGDGPPLPAEAP